MKLGYLALFKCSVSLITSKMISIVTESSSQLPGRVGLYDGSACQLMSVQKLKFMYFSEKI